MVAAIARADTFKLTTGETLNGEVLPTSANDQGVQVKIGEGQYQRVPWGSFAQEDLRNFAKHQRMEPFVQPFIEVDPQERIRRTEVDIKEPPRLQRPPKEPLLGALLSSSLGIVTLLLLYAATIYAAFEVALFRAQSPILVCSLAAIPGLGVLSPIVFLCLPTRLKAKEEAEPEEPQPTPGKAAPVAGEEDANPMHVSGAEHPTGLKLAASEEPERPALPETVIFKRGQFTFNRRFIETKFPGFFGVVRRDADKGMVLVIKSSRGDYACDRISRIAANDMHIEIHRGTASEEVMIRFQEIQEIRLKHKDAP